MRSQRVTRPRGDLIALRRAAIIAVIAALVCLGCSPDADVSWPSVAEQHTSFEQLQAESPVDEPIIADAMARVVGIVMGVDPLSIRDDGAAIVLPDTSGQIPTVGLGTAVLTGGYVLTAYHVVDATVRPIAIVGRGRQQPFRTSAELFWCYPKGDLALLELDSPLPSGLDIAGRVAVGEPVWTYARQALVGGHVNESPANAAGQTRLLSANLKLRHGDSGGPMLNLYGDLIAVNVGADTRQRSGWRRLTHVQIDQPTSLSIMLSATLLDDVIRRKAKIGRYGENCRAQKNTLHPG